MKRSLTGGAILLVLLAGTTPGSRAQEAPKTEKERIEALIKKVATLKDARFVRNDREYDAATAASAMRRKWKSYRDKVKTAEDFIDKVATVSSSSGRPYLIRFKDGREVKCGDFLHRELDKIKKNKS